LDLAVENCAQRGLAAHAERNARSAQTEHVLHVEETICVAFEEAHRAQRAL
jgi:hypothetical protein